MTARFVFAYERFSNDDLQDQLSIAGQKILCEKLADRHYPGVPVRHFFDEGISGDDPMILRRDLQSMLAAAGRGEAVGIVSEALDRLSRNPADTYRIYELLTYYRVKIITADEGEITDLIVGVKGITNSQFLKGLAVKTRRGQISAFKSGRWMSRVPYGYRLDHSPQTRDKRTGEMVRLRGVLMIHVEHAEVVLRILKLYAGGFSAKRIAKLLNAEGIPSPGSKPGKPIAWTQNTLNGNWRRATGILQNPIYVGRPFFGKLHYDKDRSRIPEPGQKQKRRATLNDQSEWEPADLSFSHLRIPGLTDELWQQVKVRQAAARQRQAAAARSDRRGDGIVQNRRPQFLFSGLTKCGQCGGGFTIYSRSELRCFNKTQRGETVCTNRRTIKRQELEGRVLRALRVRFLADPVAFEEFCAGFREEENLYRMEQRERIAATTRELDRVAKEIRGVIEAIKRGVPGDELKTEMEDLQARKAALLVQKADLEQPEPLLHPSMADAYRTSVEQLATALEAADDIEKSRAREAVRSLITAIVIPPGDGPLTVRGDLGKMLETAGGRRSTAGVGYGGCGGGI